MKFVLSQCSDMQVKPYSTRVAYRYFFVRKRQNKRIPVGGENRYNFNEISQFPPSVCIYANLFDVVENSLKHDAFCFYLM